MCNKRKKPNCKSKCAKCDYYYKNIDRIMREKADVDISKCLDR